MAIHISEESRRHLEQQCFQRAHSPVMDPDLAHWVMVRHRGGHAGSDRDSFTRSDGHRASPSCSGQSPSHNSGGEFDSELSSSSGEYVTASSLSEKEAQHSTLRRSRLGWQTRKVKGGSRLKIKDSRTEQSFNPSSCPATVRSKMSVWMNRLLMRLDLGRKH